VPLFFFFFFEVIFFIMAITTHAPDAYMSTNAFAPKVKPEHVVSFGDAIFAFAMTLMTLSIDIPKLPPNLIESQLLSRLYDMYPQV
jgi:Endosomal/lysosomal potassium channel TMEM175